MYDPHDDRGHTVTGVKIVEALDGRFVGVYFSWDETRGLFVTHVGTSVDLLEWTWHADLATEASQPTIAHSSDGGFVVGWEQEPNNHLKFALYVTLDDLLAALPTKTFEPPRQLSKCAEGTPSFYSASSTYLDVAFHYFRDCRVDRQARGSTDWRSWSSSAQPDLDKAIETLGVKSGIGDRDGPFQFHGHDYMLFEGMREPDSWETFGVFLYDMSIGSAHQLRIRTHGGSSAFLNPTIGQVTLNGRPTMVASMFIPQEAGAPSEIGGVIYFRYLD